LQGSVLLITLVVTALIGVTLLSYLTLVQSQNISVYRSQAWNSMIAATESGIEEALAHLNSDNAVATGDLLNDGLLARSPTGVYLPRRTLSNGAYYDVIITNTITGTKPGPNPEIVCFGYAPPTSTFASATP